MCLAVYKPAGAIPDWDAYETGFKSNPHGSGFAVAVDGVVEIHKGFFTFDEFRSEFARQAHLQSIVHFRLATHGKRDAANCHPFRLSPDLALIHNGVLDIDCSRNADMSDTWHYAELILKPMLERDRDFYGRDDVVFMGGAAIAGSKFAFLRGDGDFCIWNEEDGHWAGDCWWSNNSYKSSVARTETKWRYVPEKFSWGDVASDSEFFDYLSPREQACYESLLDDGYSVAELDYMIRSEGAEGIVDFAYESIGGDL